MFAELDGEDAATVLGLLADAGVGGYAVAARRARAGADGRHCVYVDILCCHVAEDLLMVFMRGKGEPL